MAAAVSAAVSTASASASATPAKLPDLDEQFERNKALWLAAKHEDMDKLEASIAGAEIDWGNPDAVSNETKRNKQGDGEVGRSGATLQALTVLPSAEKETSESQRAITLPLARLVPSIQFCLHYMYHSVDVYWPLLILPPIPLAPLILRLPSPIVVVVIILPSS